MSATIRLKRVENEINDIQNLLKQMNRHLALRKFLIWAKPIIWAASLTVIISVAILVALDWAFPPIVGWGGICKLFGG